MDWRGWTGLALLATVSACGDAAEDELLVARAADMELTVDETVELLVDQEGLPNEAQVVEALAELWIDYALLGLEVARDSTFGFVDLEPLVRQQLQQEILLAYRDSMVQVDTLLSDEELRAAYQAEAPGARVRARHILLGLPQSATEAQRDSVRRRAEELRARAAAGEDFAALARQHSQDPGSARSGGDLGFFQRGDMVRPFEEAVFDLEPGEVGPVVESPFGFHVVRLEERRTPGFDEIRDEYRDRLLQRRVLSAESTFVAGVEADADPAVADGAPELVRQLAAEPARTLSGRAGRRALATYEGGAFTTAEFQRFIQSQEAPFQDQIAQASDEQIRNFLQGMVRRELLYERAVEAGMDAGPQRVDSLVGLARDRLRGMARELGLLRLDRAPGEAVEPAVERAVEEALLDILTGASDVVPLGGISYQLRRGRTTQVYTAGVGEVILRVGRARAGRTPSPAEAAPGPDTAAPGGGDGGA